MHENPKLDFYLKHRRDIEEWAAIRSEAGAALSTALLSSQMKLSSDPGIPVAQQMERSFDRGDHGIVLPLSEVGPVGMTCYWVPSKLFDRRNRDCWPWLAIETPGKTWKPYYENLKRSTKAVATEHGQTMDGESFLWKASIELADEEIDLNVYADKMMGRLSAAWRALEPIVTETLGV